MEYITKHMHVNTIINKVTREIIGNQKIKKLMINNITLYKNCVNDDHISVNF